MADKISHPRIILAGLAGGAAMNLALLLTFRLLGFGARGDGILITSPAQSKKLIAVWTELHPLPLVVQEPLTIIVGLLGFGLLHAYVFHWLRPALPRGVLRSALAFGGLVFSTMFLFWEFFTPFNMFGEPLSLIALELAFWVLIALADGLAIAALIGGGTRQ